ncbi:MAG TPA: M20 family metallopeptidase [Candidatus Hydrogenedentes bacterium]|nr:M20 family metallopeptidase [Candidatus Hydrogenedentota bacterium]HNT87752.1 M20 family metallopeptidase [Candidatus Hydrogenedentota bacterium]
MSTTLRETITALLPEIAALRHELHQHPEIRFEERWTSDRIARFLEDAGLSCTRGWARGTGIVAEIGPMENGVVALRADMDALEIQEETGHPYASRIPGRMHACGHDGHTAILCGVAKALALRAELLRGGVRFLFQPAEEIAGGGKDMVAEGAVDGVGAVFALHAWPGIPVGNVGIRAGCAMASAEFFRIEVAGKGGHGATPASCIDPVVVAAHIITALQTIVSRERPPWEAGVVTIGRVDAGSASNIIPDRAILEGTLRALDAAQRAEMVAALRRIAACTAEAFRARAEVFVSETGYPPLHNNPACVALAHEAVTAAFGPEAAHAVDHPHMTAEDFAYYLEKTPGAFLFLGNDPPDATDTPPLHSPRFDFNDAALAVGIETLASIAVRFHEQGRARTTAS